MRTGVIAIIFAALSTPAAAHIGGLSGTVAANPIPSWMTVGTGGVIIGFSFLFTSLLTDHEGIKMVNDVRTSFPTPDSVLSWVRPLFQISSIVLLVSLLIAGLLGPRDGQSNIAILVVWVAWWVGFTMSVYLVGNTWPLLNPWRAIADQIDRHTGLAERYEYPERFGAWPSVVGLLALVWVEVVSPVASDPMTLVAIICGYSIVTIVGAVAVGVNTWFRVVDPVARVFRVYGWMAPVQRTDNGIELRLPTAALTDRSLPDRPGETAFIVALLWVTTYDGLVGTPSWENMITPLVTGGVPALVLYLIAILAGFGIFYGVYRVAARKSRETAETYVEEEFIERYFAPSLLPIAAGYHLAHFILFFLTMLPTLEAAIFNPIAGVQDPVVYQLPNSFRLLKLLFVLLGHVLAIWIAHAISFELFPGHLKPLKSQYPYVVVMIFYTMVSLAVVIQPFGAPPFV